MARKRSHANKQLPANKAQADADRNAHLAGCALFPELNAAAIVEVFNVVGKPDYIAMIDVLQKRADALIGGDMKNLERMLWAQAHALDAMFASLARRAKLQENLAPYDMHMKFALRAQSQCRATLETLAAIKNPPVVFAKQANIAHGPQQVNNGIAQPVARTEEKTIEQSELLEHDHGQRLDTGTTGAASRTDPAMATVEAIHRPAQRRRKGEGKP